MATSPFPTAVKIALESERVHWLPTGTPPTSKRPKDTKPQVQPDSKAGVTPAYLKKTQSMDAEVTTSASLQRPASGGLDATYSGMTQTSAIQFSPILSQKLFQPSDRNSYGNLHSPISLGPVLRTKDRFLT